MREHVVLKVVIVLILAVFVGSQIYSSVYNPITTQSAQFYTATDGLDITGYIVRRENIVSNTASGTLHFLVSDGERIAKNGVIADIYDSDSASITVSKIAELTTKIKDIEEIAAYNNLQAPDIQLANSRVDNALDSLIYNASSGNFSYFSEDSYELLSVINRRQAITGERTDFTAQLTELKSELSKLNSSLPMPTGSVRAEFSGYFVSAADGYENVLSTENLDGITPESLDNLKPQDVQPGAIGKIVSDYEWYIAAKVKINDSLKYKPGDSLEIKTNIRTSPVLPVTVKQINLSKSGNDAVIVFSCSQMNNRLASMRSGSMTVITKQYSGLKLSKDALRVLEGKTGVYIVSGMTVHFIPVEVIYRTDDYILCKREQVSGEVLRLYDEVIVKGKNLYEGKIIG